MAYVALWWRSHLVGAPVLGQAARPRARPAAEPRALGASPRSPPWPSSRREALPRTCRPRASRVAACCRSSSAPPPSSPASWPWRHGSPAQAGAWPPTTRSCPRGCACASSRSTASSAAWSSTSWSAARCPPRRAPAAGAHARLRAEPERVPAIAWTTIATGRGPEAHGIQAADTRRITGLRTPVSLDAETAAVHRGPRRRDRPPAPHPGAARRRRPAQRQDLLERGLGEGPAGRRRQLVGHLAGRPGERLDRDRPGRVQAGEGRIARPRGVPGRGLRYAAPARSSPSPTAPGVSTASTSPPPARCAATRRRTSRRSTCPGSTSSRCSSWARRRRATSPRSTPSSPRCAISTASWTTWSARPWPSSARTTCWSWSATPAASRAGPRSRPRDCSFSRVRRSRRAISARLGARRGPDRPAPARPAQEPRARRSGAGGRARRPFRRDHPVRLVDSYGRRPPSRPADSDFDQDVLEQLKSLGYIQ